MNRSLKNALVSSAFLIVGATPTWAQVSDTATPKLVVFITIDQMRPDYFTRF